PPQPAYILRGHAAAVHAVHFLRRNARLLTADADGWAVLWAVASRRAVAVWRAHAASVLGVGSYGLGEEEEEEEEGVRIVTHGRDNALRVWHLPPAAEDGLSTRLPAEIPAAAADPKAPWLLHALAVNTLNFCGFAMCKAPAVLGGRSSLAPEEQRRRGDGDSEEHVLVAVPGTRDGSVDVFGLPSEKRLCSLPPLESPHTG
ncbi:hypothetical protein BDY21DRAFT_273046, partial [Lineolata rhizophorae]